MLAQSLGPPAGLTDNHSLLSWPTRDRTSAEGSCLTNPIHSLQVSEMPSPRIQAFSFPGEGSEGVGTEGETMSGPGALGSGVGSCAIVPARCLDEGLPTVALLSASQDSEVQPCYGPLVRGCWLRTSGRKGRRMPALGIPLELSPALSRSSLVGLCVSLLLILLSALFAPQPAGLLPVGACKGGIG